MKKSKGDFSLKYFIVHYGIYIFLILLVLAGIFSGVEFYKEEVLNIDPSIEYEEQSTINLSSGAIDTLNPYLTKSDDIYQLNNIIYDSLFDYDKNLGYVTNIIDSYEVNTDRAYIDITLKKDIKFHDGSSLTASDVQFSVNALKACGSQSSYYKKASKIVTCNVLSKYKTRIYFNNNYNCSLDDLIFPIVSKSGYSSYYTFAGTKDKFKPNGTGIYKFKSSDYTSYLRLVPNTDYYGEQAKNKVVVKVIPKKGDVSNLATIDDITCFFTSGLNRKTNAQDNNFEVYDFPSNQLEFLVFNTTKGYTKDKAFRHTLAKAIDIEKVFQSAYMSDGMLTDTIYYPNFQNVSDTLDYYQYDYQEAMKELKNSGYEDKNGDGVLEDKFGNNLEINILVSKSNSQRVTAAKIIKKNLELIGIQVNINAVVKDEYLANLSLNNFDIAICGYKTQADMDFREFFNGKNQWGYSNYNISIKVLELDRLYEAEAYPEKYKEIKEIIIDELPYYAICYKDMSLIGVDNFEVGDYPCFFNHYFNIENWLWKKEIKTEEEEETIEN